MFSNLDIWTDNGSKIEYYWYEMPQSGTRLEVFDSEYASGSENRLQTVTGAVIDGVSHDAAMLAGPFELIVDSTVRAYAYNVAQKLPVWIEKRDGSAKETVIWTDSDPETQFEFTIYQMDGDKTGSATTESRYTWIWDTSIRFTRQSTRKATKDTRARKTSPMKRDSTRSST